MKRLSKIIALCIAMILLAFFAMFFLIYHTAAHESQSNGDALVILGAAQYDGIPSPVFQARLDHALELFKAERAPFIIVSGAKQPGDTYSEAVSGKNYLMEKGVRSDVILTDDNSFSTKQSFSRVKDIAEEKSLHHLIIVSDPFHMYRAMLIARDLGLDVSSSPTRTSPITANTWIEVEYVAREVMLSYSHIVFDL